MKTLANPKCSSFLPAGLAAKIPGTLFSLFLFYVAPLLGRPALLFAPPLLVPMAACTLIFLTQPAAAPGQIRRRQDGYSMLSILVATALSQVAIVAEWAYGEKNFPLGGPWTTGGGLTLLGAGLALRLWAIGVLGPLFTNPVDVRKAQKLVRTGPYAVIRHPSYAGAYLVALGIGVFLRAEAGTAFTAVALLAAYAYRIRREEAALLAEMGDAYRDYQRTTRKLFPGIW